MYNTSNYDKEGRLKNTTTGVEQTLYEEKVKDPESGEDKIKRRISAFGEYTKPQLGNSEPETNFGVTCRVGNSAVKPTITNTGARNLSVGTTIGETDLEAMGSKNGLQSASIGGKIGHNTYAKIGIEGASEDKPNYNATLRHQKKSSNPNCDKPITEEVSLNYRDKNSFGAKYTVYNKDTSSWGISYNQEGDNKKLFGFFNMPL